MTAKARTRAAIAMPARAARQPRPSAGTAASARRTRPRCAGGGRRGRRRRLRWRGGRRLLARLEALDRGHHRRLVAHVLDKEDLAERDEHWVARPMKLRAALQQRAEPR